MTHDGEDLDPVEGPEGDIIGYECPTCDTLKTSEGKAATHCDDTTDPDDEPDAWLPEVVPGINTGVWSTLTERMDSLMCTHPGNKNAFGPEGPTDDPDAPCTDSTGRCSDEAETTADEGCECDPRYRWTRTVNWLDFGGVQECIENDPTLSDSVMVVHQREGEAYQEPADKGMLLDGDDVVDKHGTFHPEFIEVVHDLAEGPGYASLSTSDHGSHVPLIGKLPEGSKQLKIPLSMDVEGFDYSHVDEDEGDGLHIDIFDGKHLRKATGKHVEGTPREPADIDSEALEEYCEEYGASLTTTVTDIDENGNTVEREVTIEGEAEYTGPDPDEWDIPEDSCLEYQAAVEAHYHDHSTGNFWRVTGAAAAWGNKLGKSQQEVLDDLRGADRPGRSAGYGGKTEGRVQYDWNRAESGAFEPPSRRTLAKMGVLPGEYAVEDSGGVYYDSESCAPPGLDRKPYETEQRWDELQGERYQEWLDRNRPTMIWGDDAGSGKTTNAALAAARRERSHTILFDKHEKAREFIEDDATPDGYFHLKGGEQPEHDCCMNAAARADEGETPECPVHGHPSEWPRMNPIYEFDREDDLRQRFEALVSGVGPRKALIILDEDGELLDDNPWIEQFDGLEDRDRVVGVHEYQTLKTAVGGRDLIVDETPRLLSDGRRITVDGLTRAQLRFEDLADIHHSTDEDEHLGENFRALADFAVEIRDAIAGEGEIVLEDLNRPGFKWESYFELKDPMSGQGVDHILRDETLAQLKITYNEGLVSRIREGEWNGEPFCMDALLAAAAEVGNSSDAARRAAAIPSVLDECPWCGSDVGNDNGARHCTDDACGWHEAENRIVASNTDPARAIAWLDDDVEALSSVNPALVSRILPPASDLPSPLDLDATATPTKVAGIYGEETVDVTGDEPLELDQLNTTQVIDGQYHAKTIKDTPSLQERIQSVIDTAGEVHEKPLFGIRSNLIPLFEFPENGEVLQYHAARGLNRDECDAVVCIGAPHPDIEDLKRDAELLAMDRDDLRVGGDEHSTRDNAPNPPVYRKLLYEDDEGNGIAVPTKHYTGVTGDLFRETREKELEQFVHRIRPLLADTVKDAYLLTNVPTDLPVDDVVEFDELTGDLSAVFPVCEGAFRLLRHAHDALEGNAPEGFRVTSLVEEQADGSLTNKVKGWHRLAQMYGEDVTQRTVRNWIDELETVGLLAPEKYEQRRGVSYTADIATSKRALQVLSYSAGFEVAALRRFGEKLRRSAGSIDWLGWAESVFSLSGDRCLWRPPDHGGGAPHGGPP